MSYELQGRMAEVCTCHSMCPCAVGLAPDNNLCEFSWVFEFDAGTVNGQDVSGLRLGVIGTLDGDPNQGGLIRAAMFMDERASEEQQQALVAAFSGELGGPLADAASLFGEIVGLTRTSIELDLESGSGRFRIGERAKGGLTALCGADGAPTRLTNFALAPLGHTAIPGLPTDFDLSAADLGFRFTPNSATVFEFHHQVA